MVKRSRVEASEMTIVDDAPEICEKILTLSVKNFGIKVDTKGCFSVKIMQLKAVVPVRSSLGRMVDCRNVIVADATARLRVTLWDNVSKVEEGKCYKLSGGVVKSFDREKYVSLPASASIEANDDIGEVCMAGGASVAICDTMVGEIFGCSLVEKYRSCLFCSGMVDGQKCVKCGARVKADRCPVEFMGKIHVLEADIDSPHNVILQVFTKEIVEITKESIKDLEMLSVDDIADMMINCSSVITVRYCNNVVKDVMLH